TIALLGFWGHGLPGGWLLAFPGGVGPKGLWWGLSIGLSTVAILLFWRIRWRFNREIQPVERH
ncbi:MAG: MATE family efflux transporter, partial [Planctomycetota bacterium]